MLSAAPARARDARFVLAYAARLLTCVALLELGAHRSHPFALGASGAYDRLSPANVGLLAYVTLNLMWLKFAVIWRFARLWALLDGVDTVENMSRCMNNNFSLAGFWRGWHVSFNRWLVRYVYVPLGGSRDVSPLRAAANALLTFVFVGAWHDAEPKLLAVVLNGGFSRSSASPPASPGASAAASPSCARGSARAAGGGCARRGRDAHLCADGGQPRPRRRPERRARLPAELRRGGAGYSFVVGAYAILFAGVQVMFELREAACARRRAAQARHGRRRRRSRRPSPATD